VTLDWCTKPAFSPLLSEGRRFYLPVHQPVSKIYEQILTILLWGMVKRQSVRC